MSILDTIFKIFQAIFNIGVFLSQLGCILFVILSIKFAVKHHWLSGILSALLYSGFIVILSFFYI